MQSPRGSACPDVVIREPSPGCVVVSAAGDIDADSAPAFQDRLLEALAAASRRLVIDLGPITFFDSAGIRCLITLRARARERSGDVRLVMPQRPGVRRALDIASLNHIFQVAGSVDEACANAEAA